VSNPALGNATNNWIQTVTGVISATNDIDYFRFNVAQPGSQVRVKLGGLSDDYDLVLAARTPPEETRRGLEGVTEVGGQISAIGGQIAAIGGQIAAIGGQIAAIGGQIAAIGGQISAIGGQISAISAQPGSANETIEMTLWAPGDYFVAVVPANGATTGSAYTLEVELLPSGLTIPAPAPHVAVRQPLPSIVSDSPELITTLYIVNTARMEALYPDASTEIISISESIENLIFGPPSPRLISEYGMVLDIGELVRFAATPGPSIADYYRAWDDKAANPFYANRTAQIIDRVIEAVTSNPSRPGVSGPNPAFVLGPETGTPLFLPNVEFVVLVGGDDVLPFFRVPDLTTIANEADYATYLRELDPSGIINPNSPLGAALANRMLLTDNPYGAERPYNFLSSPIHLPRLAVGRLVETPRDIAAYLERYYYDNQLSEGNGYEIDYNAYVGGDGAAFVSGYDFLIDQAEAISNTFELAGFSPRERGDPPEIVIPGLVEPLINNQWTASDLQSSWLAPDLDTTFPVTREASPFDLHADITGQLLSSVNAHFDHWQAIPANDQGGNFPALRLLAPEYLTGFSFPPGGYFSGTLHYSVGCHSGYNVPLSALSLNRTNANFDTYAADFPEAFVRHAGNWIGNTGYGYGTLDGVDYSEQLAVFLTEELLRDVRDNEDLYIGQAIGTALMQAKQRYLRNVTIITAYDAKALAVMTLYGLPFIRLIGFEEYALPPLPEIGTPNTPPPAERPLPSPTLIDGARVERIITVTVDLDNARTTLPRTGSTIFNLTEDMFTVEDSFVAAGFGDDDTQPSLRIVNNNQVGAPVLPSFAYDISVRNLADSERLVPRDVQFIGGSYGQEGDFNPQITQVVTETRGFLDGSVPRDIEPTFEAGAGLWYPARFFGLSSIETDSGIRDQLTSFVAQFRANEDGTTGAIRPYTQMVFRVLYVDPQADGGPTLLADNDPPIIEEVFVEGLNTTQVAQSGTRGVRVVVIADDANGSGLDEVKAVYIQNGTEWVSVQFQQPDPVNRPRLWTAEIPVERADLRVIVSATDAAGNTSFFTAKGSFNAPDPVPPPDPFPFKLYAPLIRQ
jgi:hypothetical protein